MMNLFKLSEQLKDLSKDQLVQEMKMPSGAVPQFLVMSELQRRSRMEREAMTAEPAAPTTVAQDTVAAAGAPQGGLAQMAQALAPKTDMAGNTGIAAMAPQPAPPVQRMQVGGEVEGPNTSRLRSLIDLQRALEEARVQSDVNRQRVLRAAEPSIADVAPLRIRLPDGGRDIAPVDEFGGLPPSMTEPGIGGVEPLVSDVEVAPAGEVEGPNTSRLRSLIDLQRALEEARVQTDVNAERVRRAGRTAEPRITDVSRRVRDFTGGDIDPVDEFGGLPDIPPRRAEPEMTIDTSGAYADLLTAPSSIEQVFGDLPPPQGPVEPEPYAPPRRAAPMSARPDILMDMVPEQRPTPFVDSDLPPYYTLRRFLFPNEDPAGTLRETERRDATRTRDDTVPVDEFTGLPEDMAPPGTGDVRPAPPSRVLYEPEPAGAPPSARPDLLDDMSDAVAPPARETETAPGGAPDAGTGGAADLDRLYEQDRWLALARFGLGLMSSREPTLGGAIGEAGAGALDYMAGARENMMDRRLQERELALQERALALRGASNVPQIPASGVGLLDEQIQGLTERLTSLTQPPTPAERDLLITQLERLNAQRDALRMRYFAQFPGALEVYLGAGSPAPPDSIPDFSD